MLLEAGTDSGGTNAYPAAFIDPLTMPIGDFPVLVISATGADPGGKSNQSFWLQLSPHSRQVTIEGPHDLQDVAPEQVVTEILKDLRGL